MYIRTYRQAWLWKCIGRNFIPFIVKNKDNKTTEHFTKRNTNLDWLLDSWWDLLINTKKSNLFYRTILILKLINTFIRVTTVGRTGVQVDATVCVHRDNRAEATVYGHHTAITDVTVTAAAAAAAVIIMDHQHLSRVSCWKTEKETGQFLLTHFERAASTLDFLKKEKLALMSTNPMRWLEPTMT